MDDAIVVCKHVLGLEPNNELAKLLLADAYCHNEKYQELLDLCDAELKETPGKRK